MTTPAATQGPTMQGMSSQQGYLQGFPAPFGIEQYLGQPQHYGGFPQQSHMQSQFPQIVQSLVSQLLPVAQQVILPQVTATALQQIQMSLYQLVTQQVNSQFGQQFGQQGGWQQPQFGQQFGQQGGWQQPQFGRSYQGIY